MNQSLRCRSISRGDAKPGDGSEGKWPNPTARHPVRNRQSIERTLSHHHHLPSQKTPSHPPLPPSYVLCRPFHPPSTQPCALPQAEPGASSAFASYESQFPKNSATASISTSTATRPSPSPKRSRSHSIPRRCSAFRRRRLLRVHVYLEAALNRRNRTTGLDIDRAKCAGRAVPHHGALHASRTAGEFDGRTRDEVEGDVGADARRLRRFA